MLKPVSPQIFIVDDEEAVRRALALLLRSAGYPAESYASVKELLEREVPDSPSCILLDVFMEGESGLELLEAVTKKFESSPVIYVSGYADIPMSVNALKRGAINFLKKPVDDALLIEAIREALQKSSYLLNVRKEFVRLKNRVDSLTPREFEIFRLVIKGMLNKQIALELSITEHTVKLHRGKVTEKLGVKNVAELIHIAERLQLQY